MTNGYSVAMILYLIYLCIYLLFLLITNVSMVKYGFLLHPPTFTTDRIVDMNKANEESLKITTVRLVGFKHWNLLPLKITVLTFHFS